MIKDDLAYERPIPLEDANSILKFFQFLEAVKRKSPLLQMPLPEAHFNFYAVITQRLVEAKELPPDSCEEFKKTFYHAPNLSRY